MLTWSTGTFVLQPLQEMSTAMNGKKTNDVVFAISACRLGLRVGEVLSQLQVFALVQAPHAIDLRQPIPPSRSDDGMPIGVHPPELRDLGPSDAVCSRARKRPTPQ